jgi:hypothetical protein
MPQINSDKIIMFSILGLVAWAIVGLPLFNSFQRLEPNYNSQSVEPKNKNSVGNAALPISKIPDHGGEPRKRDGAWYDTFREHMPDWFVAIFTGLLTLVTLLLVRSTNRLWSETRSAAAEQSVETKVLQRAYLNVLARGIETTRAGAVVGQVSIRNAGNLPARSVSVSVKIGWFDNRAESEFDSGNVPLQANVLPARAEMPRGSRALQDGRSILALKRGYIYVWGRITYQDGFGDDRWLTFCHRYACETAEGIPGSTEGIDGKFARHHHAYNDGN